MMSAEWMDLDPRGTPFGEVLSELMASRGIEPTPEEIASLAERAGLEGRAVLAYATGHSDEDVGTLGGVAEELDLDKRERVALAVAYTFGIRALAAD